MRDLQQDYGRKKKGNADRRRGSVREDTDPAMTAAGSTTTRGSGFFCVSLEYGRKVGKDYSVKVERLSNSHSKVTARVDSCYGKPTPCKTTSAIMFTTK